MMHTIQDAMLAYARSYACTVERVRATVSSTSVTAGDDGGSGSSTERTGSAGNTGSTAGAGSTEAQRRAFLQQYIDYRVEKDPAKGLLRAAFGAAWLDRALACAVFPSYTGEESVKGEGHDGRTRKSKMHVSEGSRPL